MNKVIVVFCIQASLNVFFSALVFSNDDCLCVTKIAILTAFKKFVDSWNAAAAAAGTVTFKLFASLDMSFVSKWRGNVLSISILLLFCEIITLLLKYFKQRNNSVAPNNRCSYLSGNCFFFFVSFWDFFLFQRSIRTGLTQCYQRMRNIISIQFISNARSTGDFLNEIQKYHNTTTMMRLLKCTCHWYTMKFLTPQPIRYWCFVAVVVAVADVVVVCFGVVPNRNTLLNLIAYF